MERLIIPLAMRLLVMGFLLAWSIVHATESPAADPLPSWIAGPNKAAIIGFVDRVTRPASRDFVPIPDRIAVFDNDGTLWTEQPIYPQFSFLLERVRTLAPRFPGWKTKQPFKAALEGDLDGLAAQGTEALLQLAIATHSGMTTDQFEGMVRDWLQRAKHPRFGRRYTELAYLPMSELLTYLRDHGFKTWIASGGGADFIRVWAESVYGIPPEQVIGSSIKVKFEMAEGKPLLIRMPEVDFIDNHAGKPVGIYRQIGRRPLMAFGNSDGDLEMLRWTAAGNGPRFAALIHHTDAAREYAYDRRSKVGHLDRALDEAVRRRWTVISIRDDWARLFPAEREPAVTGLTRK